MKCNNCGAEIPAGAMFCVSCGSPAPQPAQPAQPQQPTQPQPQQPVQPQQMAQPQQPTQPQPQQPVQPQQGAQPQQPVQPQMGQPGPQQPVQPQMGQPGPQQFGQQPGPQMGQPGMGQMGQRPGMGMPVGGGFQGFMNSLKMDPIKWLEVAGLFLIFISIFIPFWLTAKIPLFNIRESVGLWGSGGFWVLIALTFIVLVAIQVLIWLDVIPPLSGAVQGYKRLPFSQFYIPAYVFLACMLYLIVNIASIEGGEYLKISFGVGFWFCLIGSILCAVPAIIKLVQKTPYYA